MLKVKVFVNERQIDEICIQNVSGNEFNEFSYNRYEIVKPKSSIQIFHLRRLGWKPLVHKALEFLIEKEKEEKNGIHKS